MTPKFVIVPGGCRLVQEHARKEQKIRCDGHQHRFAPCARPARAPRPYVGLRTPAKFLIALAKCRTSNRILVAKWVCQRSVGYEHSRTWEEFGGKGSSGRLQNLDKPGSLWKQAAAPGRAARSSTGSARCVWCASSAIRFTKTRKRSLGNP